MWPGEHKPPVKESRKHVLRVHTKQQPWCSDALSAPLSPSQSAPFSSVKSQIRRSLSNVWDVTDKPWCDVALRCAVGTYSGWCGPQRSRASKSCTEERIITRQPNTGWAPCKQDSNTENHWHNWPRERPITDLRCRWVSRLIKAISHQFITSTSVVDWSPLDFCLHYAEQY